MWNIAKGMKPRYPITGVATSIRAHALISRMLSRSKPNGICLSGTADRPVGAGAGKRGPLGPKPNYLSFEAPQRKADHFPIRDSWDGSEVTFYAPIAERIWRASA